jgi:uncharacterized membrane protein
MNGYTVAIGDAIKEGWKFTKEHLGFFLGYQVLLYILVGIFSISPEQGETLKWILWHFVGWIIVLLGKMGLYQSAIFITQGILPRFDQFYQNWRLLPSWIIANFLFGLMLFIGLALLIVPGCYVLARYGFFPFLLLNKQLGPIEAFERASDLSKGIRWPLFLLFLACLGLNLVGLLFFGVGILITVPVTLCALAYVYRKLLERNLSIHR